MISGGDAMCHSMCRHSMCRHSMCRHSMCRHSMCRRSMCASLVLSFAMMVGAVAQAGAQADIGRQIAPTGKLRVGVLMLSYFAIEDRDTLKGWSPDLGIELARRAGVPH